MEVQNWKDLNVQSLDIILCAGRSKMSRRIQWFQRLTGAPPIAARISHVAGMYMRPRWHWSDMQLQESTTLNKWANKKGAQKNPFYDWLKNYDGEVYVKQLDFERTQSFYKDDTAFWIRHRHDDYENGIPGAIELLLCGLRLHRYVKKIFPDYVPEFTKEPHCTELQAKRISEHNMWNQLWYQTVFINRMPPWLWWGLIDRWLNVSVSDPILIKA